MEVVELFCPSVETPHAAQWAELRRIPLVLATFGDAYQPRLMIEDAEMFRQLTAVVLPHLRTEHAVPSPFAREVLRRFGVADQVLLRQQLRLMAAGAKPGKCAGYF